MKPAVPAATRFLAAMMRDDLVPNLTGFRAGNAAMTAAMLDMIADEWDVAAARLVDENRKLHALVARCAEFLAQPTPPALDQHDLRVSALTAVNEALRTRLIELHTTIENHACSAATALDSAIWAFLRDTVAARRIASANF